MAKDQTVRQSVSLPARVARKVRDLARSRGTSGNRVLLDLIERGIESQEREKERFLALADALATATTPEERQRLKEELAKITFGR